MPATGQFFADLARFLNSLAPFIVIIKVLFLVDYEQNNAV